MSVTSYDCFNLHGEYTHVNLLNASTLIPIINNNGTFTTAEAAENAFGDVFDKYATIFVYDDSVKSALTNMGFKSVIVCSTAKNTFHFPAGKTITYSASGGSYRAIEFTYSMADGRAYSFRYSGSSGVNYIPGLILPNPISYPSVYNSKQYYVDGGVLIWVVAPMMTMPSNLSSFTLGDYSYNYSPPISLSSGVITYVRYPGLPYGINGSGDSSLRFGASKTFNPSNRTYTDVSNQTDALANFFTEFWSIANAPYIGSSIISEGGTITPPSFYADKNEPRAFIVTPDSHHAIHSVTAYNMKTNAQIPLQESDMDLLTGERRYMFHMPAANVRIIVEFRSIEISIPVIVKYTSDRGKTYTTSFNLLYDNRNGGD